MSDPTDPPPPASAGADGDVPWATEPQDGLPPEAPDPHSAAWRWADHVLTPGRLRLLGVLSLLTTGLVIWAASSAASSSGLTAALLHRRVIVAAAKAPAATPSPAASTPSVPAITTSASTPAPTTPAPVSPAATPASTTPSTPAVSAATTTSSSTSKTSTKTTATGTTGGQGASGTTGPTGAPAAATKIKHVFIIVLASPGYTQTWGPGSAATYLTTQLRPRGTLLTNYYAIAHPDLPNYIAMVSGQPPNPDTSQDCTTFSEFPATSTVSAAGLVSGSGCVYPNTVLTIGDQFTATGRTWRAYVEDLANGSPPVKSCRHPNSNQPDNAQQAVVGDQYATRHNPFVYFHSLLDLGDCQSDDLPLTQLTTDLGSVATTANYSFIVPNLCDDGTDVPCVDGRPGGLASEDAFLQQWVPLILKSPAYLKDGLLAITFDDGPASDTSGCCQASGSATPATGGGRIGTLLLSPHYVTAGGTSTTPDNDYSLLRTVEDLFGFNHLGDAALPSVHSFGPDVLQGVWPKSP